jgi:hypothetical protein
MTTHYLVSIESAEPLPVDLGDELQRRLKEAAYDTVENSDYDVVPTVTVHVLSAGDVRLKGGWPASRRRFELVTSTTSVSPSQ